MMWNFRMCQSLIFMSNGMCDGFWNSTSSRWKNANWRVYPIKELPPNWKGTIFFRFPLQRLKLNNQMNRRANWQHVLDIVGNETHRKETTFKYFGIYLGSRASYFTNVHKHGRIEHSTPALNSRLLTKYIGCWLHGLLYSYKMERWYISPGIKISKKLFAHKLLQETFSICVRYFIIMNDVRKCK